MKSIVYIGNFLFPDGNAAGKRVYSNGKLLAKLGYKVNFIGKSEKKNNEKSIKNIDGFGSFGVYVNKSTLANQLFSNKRIFEQVRELLEDIGIESVSMVILYGELNNALLNYKLTKWLQSLGIRVVIDSVEWWNEKDGKFLFRIAKNINTSFLMRKSNVASDGIIAISSYLSNFYESKNIEVLTLPPLTSVKNEMITKKIESENFKIIYAGTPFRLGVKDVSPKAMKDRLDWTIDILVKLKYIHSNIIFDIYGLTKDEYVYSVSRHKQLLDDHKEWIIFHGSHNNEYVMDKVKNANVSMLMRDDTLVTKAGFSTKVVESIALGTPVITTGIGDNKNYITENSNLGLILELHLDLGEYAKEISTFIRKITYENNTINTDEYNVFYYENYTEEMERFLKHVFLKE